MNHRATGFSPTTSEDGSERLAHIDGLRAVAIMAVLAFHFYPALLPRGFLGVDIFFVISGYVVCRSLRAAASHGTPEIFSYLEHFYRRRFWRLAPALVAMLVTVTSAVFLVVPAAYLSRLINFTAAGAAFGVSNLVLALASGANYFSEMTAYNPFLHTWSLGVEEQFYILFPLIVWTLTYGPQRYSRLLLPTMMAGSLLIALLWQDSNPTKAFYLLPARFWELVVGALACLYSERADHWILSRRIRSGMALLGFASIAAAFALPLELATPFPAALIANLGATLALWFARADRRAWTVPGRWLSVDPMVYIGKISYSLYLWHWPITVLLRWTIGFSQTWQIGLCAVLSFACAAASYRWVEQPLQRSALARRRLGRPAFVGALATVAALSVGVIGFGIQRNFISYRLVGSLSVVSREEGWRPEQMPGLDAQTFDTMARKRPAIILVGDSHAGAISGAAAVVAKASGLGLLVSSISGCGFNLLEAVEPIGACARQFAALDSAEANDTVVFASLDLPRYVEQDGRSTTEPDADNPESIAKRRRAFAQMQVVVRKLVERRVRVIIRGPEPIFHFIPFRCSDWFNRINPVCAVATSEPRQALVERAKPALEGIEGLQREIPELIVWNVFDTLCPGPDCSIFGSDGHPLFSDPDHLSGWGNQRLLPSLVDILGGR